MIPDQAWPLVLGILLFVQLFYAAMVNEHLQNIEAQLETIVRMLPRTAQSLLVWRVRP